jgi:hypothetical protein
VQLLPALILFALLAAHLAHLPVMAHEAPVLADEPGTAEHHSLVHDDHERAGTARVDPQVQADSPLIDHGGHGPECMVQIATIPLRIASPVAMTAPVSVLNDVTAAGRAERSTLLVSPDPARRHLLLQVLLR